jgi:preprotein translocase subunit SecB
LLPPVNFELLYARSRAEAAEAQAQAAQQPLNS